MSLRRLDTGVLVRSARHDAGLTQAALAAATGTTQSAVSRWEAGHEAPRLDTLAVLLASCGFAADLAFRRHDDVDRSQIREHLALTPSQRLRAQSNVARFRHLAKRSDAGTVRP